MQEEITNPTNPTQIPRSSQKFVAIGLISVLFLILLVEILYFFVFAKQSPQPTDISQSDSISTPNSYKAPTIKFARYNNQLVLPATKSSLNEYTLKTEFNSEELRAIGGKFKLSDFEQDDVFATFSETKNPSTAGYLSFDKTNGFFTYQSLSNALQYNGNPTSVASQFLSSVGLTDGMIDCSITYKRTYSPGVTYVECHRAWEKLGAPLLTLPGVMNVESSTRISQLKPGYVTPNAPNDPTVIDTSTNQDGKVRPADFNTATFSIDETGNIFSINSNLRWISKSTPIARLITPTEALLTINKTNPGLVIPSGSGNFNWQTVFPNNTATSDEANMDDIALVYIEAPGGYKNTSLIPQYVVRGTTLLNSGFNANYSQLLSAVATNNNVLAETTTKKNLQIDTFTPTPEPSPTTIPDVEIPTPNIPPIPSEEAQCGGPVGSGGLGFMGKITYVVQLPDGSAVQLTTPGSGAKNTLYVTGYNGSDKRINTIRDLFAQVIENKYIYSYDFMHKSGQLPASTPRVSDFTNLKEYYASIPNFLSKESQADIIAPQEIYLNSTAPRIKRLMTGYEKRAREIDKGASGPGSDPLPYIEADMAMIQLGSTGGETCYLSGGSPALFIYANKKTTLSIKVGASLTYSDPAHNTGWNITTNSDGTIESNRGKRDFLYYEFNKQSVNLPPSSYGYSVKRDSLSKFSKEISQQLGLNEKESKQFNNELNNALLEVPINYPYVTISLVTEDDLNKNIPLSISENVSARRIHFLLKGTNNQTPITTPKLKKISRNTPFILELGASTRY